MKESEPRQGVIKCFQIWKAVAGCKSTEFRGQGCSHWSEEAEAGLQSQLGRESGSEAGAQGVGISCLSDWNNSDATYVNGKA